MQRFVDIGLTDVLSGKYVDFLASDIATQANLVDALYSSFAFAGYFAPVDAFGSDYFDGSTIWDLDIFSAVNECLKTHDQKDIVVDVIMTSEKTLKQVDASKYSAIHILWRYLQISRYYGEMDGLLRAQFAYPDVDFRHIIAPSENLPDNFYPLNMTADQVTTCLNQGESDGLAATTEDVNVTLEWYSLKKKQDESVNGIDFKTFQSRKLSGEIATFDFKEDKFLQDLFLQ